jgi:hypothetical protein
MRDMKVQSKPEGRSLPERRNIFLSVLLLLTLLVGGAVAAHGARASLVVAESAIVSADRLLMHGIELNAAPADVKGPVVSAESARATARKLIDAPNDPEETYRVLASATYDAPKQTAWLLLFSGASQVMSGGPPEGAESRKIAVDFIGVLIDDQTGEVLRWFRGGTLTKS